MQHRFILTAFGKDRPGIVADVTELLFNNGCNLEDTAMTMLDDEFTINLLFSTNDSAIESALVEQCRILESDKGITAFVRPLRERSATLTATANCTIHVEGLDQAGIVFRISRYLADEQLNIIDLKSTVKSTPESGTSLYLMDIDISRPAEVTLSVIEEGLNRVAEALNVDISVSD